MIKTIERLFSFDIKIFNKLRVSQIITVIGISISFLWAGYFSSKILFIPHQITYLEGAANVQTWFFLNRENPFSLEHHPIGTNNYGMLYSIIVLPFAVLFGNSLLVHRAVTLGFIILSALIGLFTVYRAKKDVLLAATCSSFIAISLMGVQGMGGISAYPSAAGTFFYMAAIFLPLMFSFDRKSLFCSALASIAAFYIKPYFILSFVIVVSYVVFFVSKKAGVIYGMFFTACFVLSIMAVKHVFPMYFIDVIWGNVFNTISSLQHMLSQLLGLFKTFLLILVVVFLILAVERFGTYSKRTVKNNFLINVSNWDKPLFGSFSSYFLHSLLFSISVFMLILGWHAANHLGYAYQLILPLFFCWFFADVLPVNKANLFISMMIVINLFTWEMEALNPVYLQEKSGAEWAELTGYLEDAESILHPPLIASDVISLGLPPIDSGHTILFYNIRPYPNTILADIPYERIRRDGFAFTSAINRRLENRKYDLVITVKDKAVFFDYWILQQYYNLVSELNIEMNMGGLYTVQIWKPNQ